MESTSREVSSKSSVRHTIRTNSEPTPLTAVPQSGNGIKSGSHQKCLAVAVSAICGSQFHEACMSQELFHKNAQITRCKVNCL